MGARDSDTHSLQQMLALGVSFSSHIIYKTKEFIDEKDSENLGVIATLTKQLKDKVETIVKDEKFYLAPLTIILRDRG